MIMIQSYININKETNMMLIELYILHKSFKRKYIASNEMAILVH